MLFCSISDLLCSHLHRRTLRQHPRHLRGVEILKDADSHLHLHPHAGLGRRDLPHRDPLSHRNVRAGRLDLRHGHVQDIPDDDLHQSGLNFTKQLVKPKKLDHFYLFQIK